MEEVCCKIKTVDELKEIIEKLKKQNKKIVQCHGVFDLVHPGHIRHLALARKEGDYLVVSITADKYVKRGPGRPIFNEQLRAETLAALGLVDFVLIDHHATAVKAIETIRPDIYVKGQDYEKKDQDVTGKIYDEEIAIKAVGGKLVFTHDISFSSSKIINEHLDVFPAEIRQYLKIIRSKYSIDFIKKAFDSMRKLKVLVIGDAIIDQYHYCESMGRSLKGHIVVTKSLSEESFAGGVFATANNLANVCGEVHLITVLGEENSCEDFILQHLKPNIRLKFFKKSNAPTTIKRRFVDVATKRNMFQICFMEDDFISEDLEDHILKHLKEIIDRYDLVVIPDFGHGLLSNRLVKILSQKAKFLAVNAQTNSANTGFNLITKYPNADYVSIDEPELRLAAHEKYLDLTKVMQKMLEQYTYHNLIVTRGSQGSIFYSAKAGFHEAPALASKIVDTIGAGDAFFAYTAPCMVSQLPHDLTSFIGNAVGALAVQIVCNRSSVEKVDLMKFITRLLK